MPFFELANSAALIGEFVPGRVQVVAAGPGSRAATYLIWDPVAEGKKNRRKVETWSFDFADVDTDSGDAGEVPDEVGGRVDEEGGGGVLEDGPAYALPGEGPDTDFAGDPFDDLLLADVPLAAAIDMCEEELVPMPPADTSVDLADANFSVDVDGGCITYYARVGDFYVICDRPNHGRGKCRKVRTRKAAAVRRGAHAAHGLTDTNKQQTNKLRFVSWGLGTPPSARARIAVNVAPKIGPGAKI